MQVLIDIVVALALAAYFASFDLMVAIDQALQVLR